MSFAGLVIARMLVASPSLDWMQSRCLMPGFNEHEQGRRPVRIDFFDLEGGRSRLICRALLSRGRVRRPSLG
jgi:hypothetical protein